MAPACPVANGVPPGGRRSATKNATVRCEGCGSTLEVRFATCLVQGWPKCCGLTMRLASYRCTVAEEVGVALERQGLPAMVRRFSASGR